jgi:cobalt/nickel transport system permease protein
VQVNTDDRALVMTTQVISNHIPDLALITFYAEKKDSFFTAISPWTKFAVLILLILFITLSSSLFVLAGLFLGVVAVYKIARLPLRNLLAWYLIPLVFVLSLVGIMAFFQPGNPVISLGSGVFALTLTDQGIILVVTLALKALVSVTYSLFFLMTTRYEHFSGMISGMFPYPSDQVFLMAYRFLFLTLAMIGSMLKAIRSRGGGLIHSMRRQSGMFAEVFALVFIRSFDRAERVRKAMDARGYCGDYSTATEVPKPGKGEYVFIGLFVLIMVITNAIVPFRGW